MTTPSPCGRVGEGSGVWFGLLVSSHTGLRPKRGGYGREDGDEDVEDFSPGAVVVESSHSVKCVFSRLDIRLITQDVLFLQHEPRHEFKLVLFSRSSIGDCVVALHNTERNLDTKLLTSSN